MSPNYSNVHCSHSVSFVHFLTAAELSEAVADITQVLKQLNFCEFTTTSHLGNIFRKIKLYVTPELRKARASAWIPENLKFPNS